MKSVKDNNQRIRILRELIVPNSQLEVEDAQIRIRRGTGANSAKWACFSIRQPGMLYEILAMADQGWIARVSAAIRDRGIFAYVITQEGQDALDTLQGFIEQGIEEYLKSCGTHKLLSMLAGSYAPYWDDDRGDYYYDLPSTEQIKAELAKRPHIPNRFERRAKLAKKEKGDKRRVQYKRLNRKVKV